MYDLQGSSHTLVADRYVIEEAFRNNSIQKPDALPALQGLLQSLEIRPGFQSSEQTPEGITLPEKDIPILAGALESGCDILITGDSRHFGSLFRLTISGRSVCTPVEAARRLPGDRYQFMVLYPDPPPHKGAQQYPAAPGRAPATGRKPEKGPAQPGAGGGGGRSGARSLAENPTPGAL